MAPPKGNRAAVVDRRIRPRIACPHAAPAAGASRRRAGGGGSMQRCRRAPMRRPGAPQQPMTRPQQHTAPHDAPTRKPCRLMPRSRLAPAPARLFRTISAARLGTSARGECMCGGVRGSSGRQRQHQYHTTRHAPCLAVAHSAQHSFRQTGRKSLTGTVGTGRTTAEGIRGSPAPCACRLLLRGTGRGQRTGCGMPPHGGRPPALLALTPAPPRLG